MMASTLLADPCGMVPPIYPGGGTPPLARTGDQQTYVFYQRGVETFVIRPGFTGKVEDFGMLIPFPTPPAIRKVPDNIFPQIAAAVDPPEVVVDLRLQILQKSLAQFSAPAPGAGSLGILKESEVRVLREEAVGMYEVAVLEAGSPAALKKWMNDHKYVYPKGMDAVCEDYIKDRWCFVAIKTKIAGKKAVEPQPGQRHVKAGLPSGAAFDGFVQGMGFRFKSPELVVPMRLSAFNEGDTRNIVYLLTDSPKKIRRVPEEYVVRQIRGDQLIKNLTGPLPLRILGGTQADIPAYRRKTLPRERDPQAANGAAKELFSADLLAVSSGKLALPHEEQEKTLLSIGERLALRGPEIDRINNAALEEERKQTVAAGIAGLRNMTLTVIDGDFPRYAIASQNLTFAAYKMPSRRNSSAAYDAKTKRPAVRRGGVLKTGYLQPRKLQRNSPAAPGGVQHASLYTSQSGWSRSAQLGFITLAVMAAAMLVFWNRRRG